MALMADIEAKVASLLGRAPRGMREVITGEDGQPRVIRVASLVDDRPFPTLYWLVDPALNLRIDRAEAGGLIARLQAQVDTEQGGVQVRSANFVEIDEAALPIEFLFADHAILDQCAILDSKILASFCSHETYSLCSSGSCRSYKSGLLKFASPAARTSAHAATDLFQA